MNSFENISLVTDLVFGLAMMIFGFAGGLFVAGWVLRKCVNTKCVPHGPPETRISRINTKCEPDEPSGK